MNKAFFINGGAGRVLCSIPALEEYAKTNDDFIIVAESWGDLYSLSKVLRDKVYASFHKDLFDLYLKDKEIVSPEPYRLNAYFNQKCNMIQAFDILINDLKEIPKTKKISIDLNKAEQIIGHNLVNEVREVTKKDKIIVFQPFGSGVKAEGNFIFDPTGRSFELKDIMHLLDELKKNYGIIIMSEIEIPHGQEHGIAMPKNVSLNQWAGIINAADYFLGCDSVGQHFSYSLGKPTTVVIGSTCPENISYPDEKMFYIIDNGKGKRKYSPIRMTMDECCDRNNEDLMVLTETTIKQILKSIKDKIGVSKVNNDSLKLSGMNGGVESPTSKMPLPMLPSNSTNFNGFQKPKTNKKKAIDQILELNDVKS